MSDIVNAIRALRPDVPNPWSMTLRWLLKAADEIERLRAELAEAKRDAERYRLELRFIANADPKQWDAEVRDQFQQWAQSRAREAIDATLAEEARTRK